MKQLLILCIGLFALSVATAQNTDQMVKNINKAYVLIPGTKFCASVCECSNADYRLFLEADPTHARYRYDSAGWNMKAYFPNSGFYNEPMTRVYGTHPAYNTYPVVNITQEAAMAYCAWLTRVYNANPNRKYKKVLFQLPTEQDWMTAALGVLPGANIKKLLPWNGLSYRDEKGKYRANFATVGDYSIRRDSLGKLLFDLNAFGLDYGADAHLYTTSCKSMYAPNDFGLYHMAGNVAEYTQTTGQAKGGSWMSPGYYLLVQTKEPEFAHMEQGGAFIGFRPFMYILEE